MKHMAVYKNCNEIQNPVVQKTTHNNITVEHLRLTKEYLLLPSHRKTNTVIVNLEVYNASENSTEIS